MIINQKLFKTISFTLLLGCYSIIKVFDFKKIVLNNFVEGKGLYRKLFNFKLFGNPIRVIICIIILYHIQILLSNFFIIIYLLNYKLNYTEFIRCKKAKKCADIIASQMALFQKKDKIFMVW